MRHLRNIFNLGIKELRSLLGDKAMLTLIVFSFTVSVYSSATVTPGSLNLAPIAIADMDQSQLSNRIVNSFYRPWFLPPEMITADEMDAGLDAGRYTFAINIPPNFQRDVLTTAGAFLSEVSPITTKYRRKGGGMPFGIRIYR